MGRHPIVLLNGCETAGGGFFAVEDLDFPSIFLCFGVRGVIATAPIRQQFSVGVMAQSSSMADYQVGESEAAAAQIQKAISVSHQSYLNCSENHLTVCLVISR